MNLVTTIRAILIAESDVTDIVDTGDDAKIWDAWPRTITAPLIVIENDGEAEDPELDGTVEWVTSEVTITCRAETSTEAHTLQRAVRSALAGLDTDDWSALLDYSTPASMPKKDGSTAHWYDQVMSFTFTFSEAA